VRISEAMILQMNHVKNKKGFEKEKAARKSDPWRLL
jgi:hypothetical protein